MYECPNCGGDLRFDIASQKLKCEHCDSTFDPYSVYKDEDAGEMQVSPDDPIYGEDASAKGSGAGDEGGAAGDDKYSSESGSAKDGKAGGENGSGGDVNSSDAGNAGDTDINGESSASKKKEYQITVFTCKSCGAEISSTNLSATGFCSYCGQPAIFSSRIKNERKPEKIIPFRIDKNDCKEKFINHMKGALYAPKEYTDPEALSNFVGIYMPYWIYDFSVGPEAHVPASRSKRKGNYIYTDKYNLTLEMTGEFKGIAFDASSSFDDHIAEVIAPYEAKDMMEFTPSFLCGFYADVPDVPSEVYRDDAEAAVISHVYEGIDLNCIKGDLERNEKNLSNIDNARSSINLKYDGEKEAMLPVWFLTYRNDDRVCYSVVNGVTGKISADVPVDYKKFYLVSGLMAIPIFFMLNLGLTLQAYVTLFLSIVLSLIILLIYMKEIKNIDAQENRKNDQGYAAVRLGGKLASGDRVESNAFKNPGFKTSRKKKSFGFVDIIAYLAVAYWVLNMALGALYLLMDYWQFIVFGLLIIGIWFLVDMINEKSKGKKKTGSKGKAQAKQKKSYSCFDVWGIVAGLVVGVMTFVLNPIDDIYYYAASAFVFAGAVLTITGMIRKYNLLSTHPIPEYFDRDGGNVHA